MLYFRSHRKVILFYDYTAAKQEKSSKNAEWVPNKIEKLPDMKQQVNQAFPENQDTEYLLSTACRQKDETLS